jgi:hypothetical protein
MQAILWNNQGARLLQLGDLETAVVWIHSAAMIIDGVPMSHPKIDKGCDTTEQWKRHDCDGFQIAQAETEPAAQLIEPMDPSSTQEHACCFLHHGKPSDGSVSVYQQPLFLSTCTNMASLDGDVSIEKFVRGAICFNLAEQPFVGTRSLH